LTFPIGDLEVGTAGLRALLSEPALREKVGHAAEATAHEFSVDNMVDIYCSLYARCSSAPACLRS
jgi:hypothetical protein